MSNPFPELTSHDPAYQTPRQIKPRVTESWLADEMQRDRDDSIRKSIVSAPPPDQVARATRLAREADAPPIMVDERPDETEKALNAKRMTDLAGRYPAIGKWAANNPRGAAAAADDHKSLGLLGGAFDFLRGIPGALQSGYYATAAVVEDFNQSIDEFILPFTNPSGGRALLEQREQVRGSLRRREDVAMPQSDSFVVRSLHQGIKSVPTSLAALAVGVATRSPNAAATAMGVGSGVPAYREALDRGKSTGDALRYGVEQGLIEALTERMPAGAWLDAITKRTPFGKTILRQLATEIPGEQMATALQDLSTWVHLNPDQPFSTYLEERPEAALATALATISGTSAQVGAAHVARRSVEVVGKARQRSEIEDARRRWQSEEKALSPALKAQASKPTWRGEFSYMTGLIDPPSPDAVTYQQERLPDTGEDWRADFELRKRDPDEWLRQRNRREWQAHQDKLAMERQRQGEKALNARAELQALDQMNRIATESKLRQRDPDEFKRVIGEFAADYGAPFVFIEGEAVAAYVQVDRYEVLA